MLAPELNKSCAAHMLSSVKIALARRYQLQATTWEQEPTGVWVAAERIQATLWWLFVPRFAFLKSIPIAPGSPAVIWVSN